MLAQVSYPGVYIQELSSGAHTITGVATAIAAFVGYTPRGAENVPKRIFSFADYERAFGGLAADSELGYSVSQFFDNGGSVAWVVRVAKKDATAATVRLFAAESNGSDLALGLAARNRGVWANRLVIDVEYGGVSDASSYNLTFTDRSNGTQEVFANVSGDSSSARFVSKVLKDPDNGSSLVTVVASPASSARPAETGTVGADITLSAIDTSKADYKITVKSDVPPTLTNAVDVTVFAKGDPVPSSILGLARLVERKINLALQVAQPGAAVRCVPSASGKGLRVFAEMDPQLVSGSTLDAVLTITDSAKTLGLDNRKSNVGHYVFGTGRAAKAQNQGNPSPIPGSDGKQLPGTTELVGDEASFTGLYALDRIDLFNLLCIPDATRAEPANPDVMDAAVDPNAIYAKALSFLASKGRRAFVLIDPPPNVSTPDKAADWKSAGLKVSDKNAAAYFPRLRLPDALDGYKLRTFAPCGVVAGLYARIDATRGIWKAPAGVEATLSGVRGQAYALTDLENGMLNKLGLNCMRNFPIYGHVAWGSRTLVGADDQGSEWKYVPVRRLALYIEESLFRGTKWVVFEPNDEPLWAQIRLNVRSFMHDLYRQGAFFGSTPNQAYLVKCDGETTTQQERDNGIVNILVAFAPLKPAEFVVIQIRQIAGQVQA